MVFNTSSGPDLTLPVTRPVSLVTDSQRSGTKPRHFEDSSKKIVIKASVSDSKHSRVSEDSGYCGSTEDLSEKAMLVRILRWQEKRRFENFNETSLGSDLRPGLVDLPAAEEQDIETLESLYGAHCSLKIREDRSGSQVRDSPKVQGTFANLRSLTSPRNNSTEVPQLQAFQHPELPTTDASTSNCFNAARNVKRWIDSTSALAFDPSMSPEMDNSKATVVASPCSASKSTNVLPPSKTLIRELIEALDGTDQGCSVNEDSLEDDETLFPDSSLASLPPTDAPGQSSSSGGRTTRSRSLGKSTHTATLSSRSNERRGDKESSSKRLCGGPILDSIDKLQTTPTVTQMPCPLLSSSGCYGTNVTISELLRSLQIRHRIIICKDCCTQLEVPAEVRKPEDVLKRHASQGCEPQCISQSCTNGTQQEISPIHRRAAACPSWQTLSKVERWAFIWALINPGLEPPTPDFSVGEGFEHSTERRINRTQPRNRVTGISAALLQENQAMSDRINDLERELAAYKASNTLLQDRSENRSKSLEDIIEMLIENTTRGIANLPTFLKRKLRSECPKLTEELSAAIENTAQNFPSLPYSVESMLHTNDRQDARWAGMSHLAAQPIEPADMIDPYLFNYYPMHLTPSQMAMQGQQWAMTSVPSVPAGAQSAVISQQQFEPAFPWPANPMWQATMLDLAQRDAHHGDRDMAGNRQVFDGQYTNSMEQDLPPPGLQYGLQDC
ncbi:hypothetical protein NX059_003694 [Plenodomus lindquistii]|nr:hypothetical protein NX059_003694 [Plenodomus lindquistii]